MSGKEFDLGDYVQVRDRIAKFYDLYGQGRLVTGEVRVTREPDDKPRVWVEAFAYRNPDDTLPGHGWSWMELPGTSSFTRGSELENTETSAWGRAIASLGILTDHSIASAQEVRDKTQPPARDGDAPEPLPPTTPKYEETEELLGRITKAGTVKKGTSESYKLDFRQSPDDKHTVGFRLEVDGDRAIPQVLVEGEAGEALYLVYGAQPDELVGQKVTVKGRLYSVKATGRATYTRLRVTEITTPDMAYPAPSFSPDEQAAIDDAIAATA